MAVITVGGPIAAEKVGFTLMHEHVFSDLGFYARKPNKLFPDGPRFEVSDEPLSLANLGRVRRNFFSLLDNLKLDDTETAVSELLYYKSAGGATLVDITPKGLGRAPEQLREVSRRSGVNIVAATGYYLRETFPSDVETRTAEDLASEMVRDITEGIGGTGIRAGIIGEIGLSPEPDEVEVRVHRAAAIAHKETGAAIVIHHCSSGPFVRRLLDFLAGREVDLSRVIISHVDCGSDFNWDYLHSILKAGACASFDNFGWEHPRDWRLAYSVTDLQRAQAVARLVSEGFATQLLISSDVSLKMLLCAYGGWGYAHVPRNALPYLRFAGLDDRQLDTLFMSNPARLLDLKFN